jgi:maltose phosphorylase
VHAILAAKLGDEKRAYEFYLRTSRLDLDDYNNDTEDGCHITSMAGTWMSVVEGFGGMRVRDGKLSFSPFLPEKWNSFSFNVGFRSTTIKVTVSKEGVKVKNLSGKDITILVYQKEYNIFAGQDTLLKL